MLDQMQVTSLAHPITLSPVPSPLGERETGPLPLDRTEYVPLQMEGKETGFMVSSTLNDGYLAARTAYAEMEETEEYGAYFFLTGYEYAHLARQYIPGNLSPVDRGEWHRGFVVGCNVSTFGL
jgi:hypothetical protein